MHKFAFLRGPRKIGEQGLSRTTRRAWALWLLTQMLQHMMPCQEIDLGASLMPYPQGESLHSWYYGRKELDVRYIKIGRSDCRSR